MDYMDVYDEMKEYLKRLSELILFEIGIKNQSYVCFAELCGLSRNEISDIINLKKRDIRLSTIVSICENSDIRIEDIFSTNLTVDEIESKLKNTYLVISGKKYSVQLAKLNRYSIYSTINKRGGTNDK